MTKISFFKNRLAISPSTSITVEEFVNNIRDGEWKSIVERYRVNHDKRLKEQLPGVTLSGLFKNRDKKTPVEKRLIKHSGFICLDIDGKDNPDLRIQDLVDKDAYAQFKSCGGEGIKIIYRCVETKDAAEHRRIYDGLLQRLAKRKITLKVDPIVKSIASLQYVSYDFEAYINTKTKFIARPLPPIKRVTKPKSDDIESDKEQLADYIKALGTKDITKSYEEWLSIMFGLSYSLGEDGRKFVHLISKNYKNYSKIECDEKYDGCLESVSDHPNPITIATVFNLIRSALPKGKLKELEKKYKRNHAIGVGEDVEQEELRGYVRYKLFLFKKKTVDNQLELTPAKINLNAFESLLKSKGFYRYDKLFVHIVDNIVSVVDDWSIIRMVTNHIEDDGNYTFTYNKIEYNFSWEELVHLWREVRVTSGFNNQIRAALTYWEPNLLRDNPLESFIPYRNGVIKVTAKEVKLLPYKAVTQQIWKERILPREFKPSGQIKNGMFEKFFANINGGDTKSVRYKRALWYFGYMLQSTKQQSNARAWLLYDSRTGKNGRTGKTILGTAVSKIRSVAFIDGKSIDFRNRFAFQSIQPWTNVIFIDDPYKTMSLDPIFNMITGTVYADKKGMEPLIKDDIKIMVASNWILENEGESEKKRQFVTQLTDFYTEYGKSKNTIIPVVEYHGKEFFNGWDVGDWQSFDLFCCRALQYHLREKMPGLDEVKDAAHLRFVQLHSEDMYMTLKAIVKSNIKQNGQGYLIPRGVLINEIKEFDSSLSAMKSGKIARDFLNAIGADSIEVISETKGSMVVIAYKIKGDIKL